MYAQIDSRIAVDYFFYYIINKTSHILDKVCIHQKLTQQTMSMGPIYISLRTLTISCD